jgi:chitodextrinase
MYLRITRRSLKLRPVPFFFILPLIFIFFLQGCTSNSVSVKQDPPAVTISISPTAASVVTTKTQPFTATVTNATNTAVTWQVNGVTGGDSTHGTISASGLYTAPSSAPNPATVTVSAILQTDATKSASATVTIAASQNPVVISISPTVASVVTTKTQPFTATVTNTTNTAVTWQVNGLTGGDSTHGTISASGLYTAPSAVPSPATVTVSAISQADPTKSASATVAISSAPDTTAPTAPSGLTAVASSTTQIGLTWAASTDNVAVTSYRVERCTGASCTNFAQIGAATTLATFSDSGLTASTAYRYRVRASDAAGNLSNYSNIAFGTTLAVSDTTAPTAPSSLVATASSSTQIGLVWIASTDNVGVTGYRVERCSGANCTSFAQIGTTTTALSFPDSGLMASTSYSYRVRATDAAGNLSNYSNTATATTTGTGGSSITVSVSPKLGGLVTSQILSVKATLTNDTGNQGVNWSASGGGSFSQTTSTSGNAVTFTAPASAGVVTITATSVADGSKTASATIGVTDLIGVLTYHNNASRDGTNQKEYALTTGNVNTSTFGKLFSCPVDGAVYAQPLWVASVTIGSTKRNVLVVATQHDSVYAFDADTSPCVTLWHANLLDTAHGGTSGEVPAPSGVAGGLLGAGLGDIAPEVGVTGTPVIDPSTNTIYVVSKSENTGTSTFYQRLHALSLTAGTEKLSGPASIDSSITVSGTGDGSSGGTLAFDPRHENQRPGLALVNGVVYVSWASHEDDTPYHGWVMGFNASTLALQSKFNTSPNGGLAGIWMSGGAPAADASNNLYLMTGNGTFDADAGGSDYGDSYLKLSSGLSVTDWFTPSNQDSLSSADQDVGAGGTALLFGQTLLVGAGKSGTFYVLDRNNMGHFSPSTDAVVQTWTASHAFSTPAFWNNTMYYFGVSFGSDQVGEAFAFNTTTGLFNTIPTSQTPTGFGFPGATPSISSSGTSNGIVWAINSSAYCTQQSGSCAPAVLHAYSATTLANELWNSSQGSGDAAGNAVKFTVPTVANGKVYIGTRGNNTGGLGGSTSTPGEIDVYGLLPN